MPKVQVGTEKNQPVELFYEDAGSGDPVVLIHGWPLSHAMWEYQTPVLVEAGHRVISYDRRGFGDSSQTWDGYDYDTFASDLNELINTLSLNNVTLVGFSMGGGEVARYIGTYGTSKLKRVVLAGAVTPYLAKTEDNPDGVDQSVLMGIGEALQQDRAAFLPDFFKSFYNYGLLKKDVTQETLDYSFQVAMSASPRATLESAKAFGFTDFRADLAKFDVPTLVVHGSADKTVPFEASGERAAKAISGAQLEVIDGAPHAFTATHTEEFNQILVKFLGS